MALHEDSLGALRDRAALESSFKVTVFGEAPQDDLDRVLPLLRVAIRVVGEDAATRRLDYEVGIRSCRSATTGQAAS